VERFIINFGNRSLVQAKQYPEVYSIVDETVRPVREQDNREQYRRLWWQFAEKRKALSESLASRSSAFVAVATAKYLAFSKYSSDGVFGQALKVFATERWEHFALVQSTVHEVWARKYSGSLETRLRYSPTDCFENFPFPAGQWQTPNAALAALGGRYHEHRRTLMRHSWRGLTDVYNLFHSPLLRPATPDELALSDKDFEKLLGKDAKSLRKHLLEPKAPDDVELWDFNTIVAAVLQLRQLHVQLDNAVRDAYGWGPPPAGEVGEAGRGLDLEHNFYDVDTLPENDRTRYTISPVARKEVLKRLLALNHERRAEEEAKGLWDKKGKKKKSDPGAENKNGLFQEGGLFDQDPTEPEEQEAPKRGRPKKETYSGEATAAILEFLKANAGLHGKSAVLEGSGVDAKEWNAAIKQLLEEGKVVKEGAKKGARYGS